MTGLFAAESSLLLLVDMQEKLMPAIAGAEDAIRRAGFALDAARALGVPVIATEHYPERIGHTVPPLAARQPAIVVKRHFNAAAEPGLLRMLPPERRRILICGAESHVCVYQTAVGLLDLGRHVAILADACGSWRVEDHQRALEDLQRRGARIATVEQAGFEWLQHGDHPQFRPVLQALKSMRAGSTG